MALKHISASPLSDIAKHTPELAHTVVDSGAIAHLAQMILNPDAKLKCKKALKNVLQKCTHLPALEPLLYEAPSNILKHVVCQFSKGQLFLDIGVDMSLLNAYETHVNDVSYIIHMHM
ncbi:unnamed protein product [Merluccius merluccius]